MTEPNNEVQKEMGPKEKLFRILAADASPERSNNLRIQGTPLSMRIARTETEFMKSLMEGNWELVITSLNVTGITYQELINHLLAGWREKKFRGVIVTCLVDGWAKKAVQTLRAKGCPARWYPYNYNNPSLHIEKKVED